MKFRVKKLKRLSKYWWVLPILIIGISGFAAWKIMDGKSDRSYVQCLGTSASADYKCWEQRYEKMVANESPKAAFADVKIAYEQEPYVTSGCHQIAHVIGRAAAEKYGDVSDAYEYGDNFCWSGFYHGVIEGVAKELGPNGLIEKINEVCAKPRAEEKYSFYHYNCVHGLGHGTMIVSNNNLFKALEDCDKLQEPWERDSCYGGSFMENVMSDINPDHKTEFVRPDEPLYPCTAVNDKYKLQCYLMQTSYALKVMSNDYKAVSELCATTGQFAQTCWQSLGRDASGSTTSNIESTKSLCMQAHTAEARENCVIGAVKDFISYHHDDAEALKFCESLEENLRNACVPTANSYYQTF